MNKEQIEKAVSDHIGYSEEIDEGIDTKMIREAFMGGSRPAIVRKEEE